MYRAAWALCGSHDDAEDLVQETYARVLSRPRFLRDSDELGYLLRTLRNTHIDLARRRARRPARLGVELEDLELADPAARGPDEAVEAREVFAAIAALPDEFRDVLVAVDVAGLSYNEAAAALRVRQGTVMSRLYRARERVARAIGPPGMPAEGRTS